MTYFDFQTTVYVGSQYPRYQFDNAEKFTDTENIKFYFEGDDFPGKSNAALVETSSTVRRNGKRLVRIELKKVSGGDGIYEHKPQVGAMCI